MSAFRFLSATLLSAMSSFSVVAASGCGTEAVGVDDCRVIEQARCDAGQHCGLVDDVQACRRFYRDQCLHGLSARAAAGTSVAACVSVIQAAGRCAAQDPEIALADCGEEPVPQPLAGLRSACDVVLYPERTTECSFLAPDLEVPEGTGGQGSTGSGGAPSDTPQAGQAQGAAAAVE